VAKKFLAFAIPALMFIFMMGALMFAMQQYSPQPREETGATWIPPQGSNLEQRNAAQFAPGTRTFNYPASPTSFGSVEHKGFIKAPTGD